MNVLSPDLQPMATAVGYRTGAVDAIVDETAAGEEAALYSIWVGLHRGLAAESTRGRQQFVQKSGHFIAVDQPATVVGAIREVVDLVRQRTR
jgi:hypothetical protein